MPSGAGTGTNPIHNKKPKKKPVEEDDDEDKAHKAKQIAGTVNVRFTELASANEHDCADKKARDELAKKAAGKGGPLNTGQQGIKKSGKK
ncbi:hypothetical protein LTR08_008723 [Meristemomyces frigidus]|nr:hypothetical protein LTR08_008723 [Meristemomyces frigidus]